MRHGIVSRFDARLFAIIGAVSILSMDVYSAVLGRIGISGIVKTAIMAILCYLPILISIAKRPWDFPIDAVIIAVAVCVIYGITLIAWPEYKGYLSSDMWGAIVSPYGGVICYFVIRMLKEPKDIEKVLLAVSFIMFIYFGMEGIQALGRGYWILVKDGIEVKSDYSMSYGYRMLLPTVVFAFKAIRDKKFIYMIMSAWGALSILLLGSRMAAISVLGFIALYVFFVSLKDVNIRKKTLVVLAIFALCIVIALFHRDILLGINSILEKTGHSSRTIEKLISGTIVEDEARNVIYDKVLKLIAKGGPFGYGMLSDRYYVGSYCHNIFLEFFLDFGFLGGTILSAILIAVIVKMIVINKDTEWRGIFIILFSCSFFPLLVSHSFWTEDAFWMMLAVTYRYLRYNKKQS